MIFKTTELVRWFINTTTHKRNPSFFTAVFQNHSLGRGLSTVALHFCNLWCRGGSRSCSRRRKRSKNGSGRSRDRGCGRDRYSGGSGCRGAAAAAAAAASSGTILCLLHSPYFGRDVSFRIMIRIVRTRNPLKSILGPHMLCLSQEPLSHLLAPELHYPSAISS